MPWAGLGNAWVGFNYGGALGRAREGFETSKEGFTSSPLLQALCFKKKKEKKMAGRARESLAPTPTSTPAPQDTGALKQGSVSFCFCLVVVILVIIIIIIIVVVVVVVAIILIITIVVVVVVVVIVILIVVIAPLAIPSSTLPRSLCCGLEELVVHHELLAVPPRSDAYGIDILRGEPSLVHEKVEVVKASRDHLVCVLLEAYAFEPFSHAPRLSCLRGEDSHRVAPGVGGWKEGSEFAVFARPCRW